MPDLSLAAQAVLDAFTEDNSLHDWKHNHYNLEALAAALRAAADQVVPVTSARTAAAAGKRRARADLLAIATELETHQ